MSYPDNAGSKYEAPSMHHVVMHAPVDGRSLSARLDTPEEDPPESQDFYASHPPLEWKLLGDEIEDGALSQYADRVIDVDPRGQFLQEDNGRSHTDPVLDEENGETGKYPPVEFQVTQETDMFPRLDILSPLDGWWNPSQVSSISPKPLKPPG